ncbi:MAG: hypothetical protein N2111_13855, partial [Candidatus Sumerlaeaceae bacterium]|nr:hypothetical protein [Candidatus Sumerlaeaceae bacterium]
MRSDKDTPAEIVEVDIPLVGGITPDSFADTAVISDCNNLEMLPDGSAMFNRRGMVKYKDCQGITTDPGARGAYLLDTSPPNVEGGKMLAIMLDTSTGHIESMDITTIKGYIDDSGTPKSVVYFAGSQYITWKGVDCVLVLRRLGGTDKQCIVEIRAILGAGASGHFDITDFPQTVLFEAGQTEVTVAVNGVPDADQSVLPLMCKFQIVAKENCRAGFPDTTEVVYTKPVFIVSNCANYQTYPGGSAPAILDADNGNPPIGYVGVLVYNHFTGVVCLLY